ncbi:hypothetical protein OROGR_013027 [Orobanche gracilis]
MSGLKFQIHRNQKSRVSHPTLLGGTKLSVSGRLNARLLKG